MASVVNSKGTCFGGSYYSSGLAVNTHVMKMMTEAITAGTTAMGGSIRKMKKLLHGALLLVGICLSKPVMILLVAREDTDELYTSDPLSRMFFRCL